MKPYYEHTGITIYHGDCLEIMPTLQAASVDLVLCDLPYGTTQNKWDAVIPFNALWVEYERVCVGAIVLTASQPFTSALVMSNAKGFRYSWTWDKVNRITGFLNAKRQPLRNVEDILVFWPGKQTTYNPQMAAGKPYRVSPAKVQHSDNYGGQKPVPLRVNEGTRYPTALLVIPGDERGTVGRIHPTQKPVALMEYLIKTYTNPGDTVLDNCMGSGTTGVACVNTGRSFIGIEIEERYCEIAAKRLASEEPLDSPNQPLLFGAPDAL